MQRRRAQGEQQESNPPRSRELDLVILLGHFQLEVFHDFMAAVFANDSENLYFIYLSYMTWQIMVIVDLVIALLNKKNTEKTQRPTGDSDFKFSSIQTSQGYSVENTEMTLQRDAKINDDFCISMQISTKCEQCAGKNWSGS